MAAGTRTWHAVALALGLVPGIALAWLLWPDPRAALGLLIGVAPAWLLAHLLLRQQANRIDELGHALRRISAGVLGTQLPVRTQDAFASLMHDFNSMSARLLHEQSQAVGWQAETMAREEDERLRLEYLVARRTEALEEAGRKWRALVENMPVNVVRYDPDCRIQFASPGFVRQSGLTSERILGYRLAELGLVDAAEADRVEQLVRAVARGGRACETELRLPGPHGMRVHQLRMVQERNAADEPSGVLVVGMDVTQRRADEARLALMSLAINQVAESALLLDESANLHFANQGAGRTLGFAPEDMIGMHLSQVRLNFDAALWQAHWQELKARGNLTYEVVNRCRDGREIQMEVNATYFEVDGKGYDLALGRDISARKQLDLAREAALREAERLARAKSEFLANMSHELRTPLSAVLGMAQLGMRVNAGQRASTQFAAILDAGQLLQSLVDDILDFSKIEAGRLSLEQGEVVVGPLIDRVVELTAARAYAKGLDFLVSEAADLPDRFPGDPLRVVQVLVNLLGNAVKFTERGSISLAVRRDGEALSFTVADTGIGMDAEQIGRLFIPFEQADGSTTRRYGGTGLGLAISKRLVDLMHGRLTVQGQPGLGMTFEVRLPVPDMAAARPPETPRTLCLSGPSCALALIEELREWGMAVSVGDLPEALAGEADLTVLPYSCLARADNLPRLHTALARGRRLAAILPPGGMYSLPSDLAGRMDTLVWPPRSRHLRRILAGEPAPPGQAGKAPDKRLAGLRLLVAEDNDMSRMILEELLVHEGAHVTSEENGLRLVERIEREADAFDLVITDVQMPEMDGHEATRRIHAMHPALPVIGLTAHVMADARERCLRSGMVAHVGKPVRIEDLVQVILAHAPPHPSERVAQAAIPMAASPREVTAPPPGGEIDWRALAAAYPGGDVLIRKALAMLLDSQGDLAARLRATAAGDDPDALRRLLHGIKGTAGNLRATRLATAAAALEDAVRQGARRDADIDLLAAGIERLMNEARRHLDDTAG